MSQPPTSERRAEPAERLLEAQKQLSREAQTAQSGGATGTVSRPAVPLRAPSIVVSRNLFAGQSSRPETDLTPGAALSLVAQRVRVADVRRLKVESPDESVAMALRFRRGPGEVWSLTAIVVARPRPHDYLYLSSGELVRDGHLGPQTSYRIGPGLETELTPEGQAVQEIVVQDEGEAEIRLLRSDDTLVLTILTPREGGHPSGAPHPWYLGEPLRFQDYQVLVGGYSKAVLNNELTGWILPSSTPEHGFLEATVRDAIGVRAAGFAQAHESFAVEQLVVTTQPVRGDWWSLWAEAGAAGFQRTLSPSQGPTSQQSGAGWTAGVAAHLRFGDWGGTVRWADAAGLPLTQALAGWQATRHFGVALSWISYRSASPTGLAFSFGF